MEKVTQEQVFIAADTLVGEGKTASVKAVRDWLGKGSHATITPLMREWRKQRQEAEEAAQPALPDALQALLTRLGGQVWAEAEKSASARLAGEKAALEAERDVLIQERDEAIEAADSAAVALVRMGEAIERANADAAVANAELARLREQLAAAEAARDAFKVQAEKLDAALERAARAEGALAALQGEKPASKPAAAKKGKCC